MKKNKLHFLTFGDVAYDQRMQRIWKSLYDEGYEINIIARRLYEPELINFPYNLIRIRQVFQKNFLAYAEFNVRAFFILLFRHTSVISCVDLDTLPAGVLLKILRRGTLIYDAHEWFTEAPELSGRPFVRRFWGWIARYGIPRANNAYTVSNGYAVNLGQLYRKEFMVVRNVPLKMNVVNAGDIASREKIILYQGALNQGRGLENLIRAVTHVPGIKLIIAGRGDVENELKNMILELEAVEQITMTGNILPEELVKMTREAWLGINILEDSGKSYYYSLANKYFDYIQANIPQICIDFPEYHDLNSIYETAYLLSDISVPSIVKAIVYFQENEKYYQRLKNNTIAAAEEFNWEKESLKLLHIYSS